MHIRGEKKRWFTATSLFFAAALAVLLFALGGCTYSSTITQVVYDNNQDSPVDSSQSVMVNDIKAEQTTTSLPKLTNDSSDSKQDSNQDLPKYGEGESNALVAAPVTTSTKDNSKSKGEADKKRNTQKENKGNVDPNGQGEGKKSTAGKGDKNKNKGKGQKASKKHTSPLGAGKNKNNDVKVYKDYGDFPDIPKDIKYVTAVGQAALIVSMLGGSEDSTPLLGADDDFTGNKSAKKMLAKRGIAKVKTWWKNDGSSEGDLKSLDTITHSKAQLCFVMEGDDTFSSKQEKQLLKANIIVYMLPSMTSASKIKSAVSIVGQILKEGGNDQAGERADEYASFHKELIKTVTDKNGGYTGGFNYDTGKKASSEASSLSTLFISDWDYKAHYSDDDGFLNSSQGVGIADLGYEEHPISYYLSAGGANNVAATDDRRVLSGHTAVVWQFSLTQASLEWKNWTSIDRSKVDYPLKGDGYDNCMLFTSDSEVGLGTDGFPAVIVADQKMKKAMQNSSKKPGDIYYPYPMTENRHEGSSIHSAAYVGYSSNGHAVRSCIGLNSEGKTSLNNDGEVKEYSILVNPSGAFSDWAAGGVESVLESAWAYKTFRSTDYDLKAKVKEFYESFYGYELTDADYDAIIAGKSGK